MSYRKSLSFELLEERQLLSVSANNPALHVALADEYTGVLRSRNVQGTNAASSVLLPTGRHLLTAAHVANSRFGVPGRIIETHLPAPNDLIPTLLNAIIPPDYILNPDPGFSSDLAIMELPFELPSSFERYDIYRGSAELGIVATFVGFGASGEDAIVAGLAGVKRIGVNRYGDITSDQKVLRYDFDDDLAINRTDPLGDGPGIHGDDKLSEVISGGGDSGGPGAFFDGKIVGIKSIGVTEIGQLAYNKIGRDSRVSYAAAWIDAIIDEAGNPQVTDVIISGSTSSHAPYSFADQMNDPSGNWSPGDQLRNVPVGGADTVAIEFSEHVLNIDENSLLLKGLTTGQLPQLAASGFDYDVTTHTATWTFDTPFVTDQLYLSLSDTVTDTGGNLLDGEWINPFSVTTTNSTVSEFPSGNGAAGGDFNFVFTILPGDASLDNDVDGGDVLLYLLGNGQTFQQGDFNGEGGRMATTLRYWERTTVKF